MIPLFSYRLLSYCKLQNHEFAVVAVTAKLTAFLSLIRENAVCSRCKRSCNG